MSESPLIQGLKDCRTRLEIQSRENRAYINGLDDALEAFERFIPDVLLTSFNKTITSRKELVLVLSEEIRDISELICSELQKDSMVQHQTESRDLN